MFVLEGRQAIAELREQGEIDVIVQGLESAGYSGVMRSMLRAAAQSASVEITSLKIDNLFPSEGFTAGEVYVVGELFFSDQHAHVLQRFGSNLIVWEIRHHAVASRIEDFCARVEAAAREGLDGRRVRGMDFTWANVAPELSRASRRRFFKGAELSTNIPVYSAIESRWAQLVSNHEKRAFLLGLAQVRGKARAMDATLGIGPEVTQPLLDSGLLRKEYIVSCRQDSHTICSVTDRLDVETGVSSRLRCSVCERPFGEELLQEILVLTTEAEALLAKSRWMTIWVTDLLIASGVGRGQISWNAAAGEDEIDIMLDLWGLRIFFELKDREFGSGDAVKFLFRVQRYGGDFGTIISTDRVSDEVKKLVKEERPRGGRVTIDMIEGTTDIEPQMDELTDRLSRRAARRLVADALSAGPDLWPVLGGWMSLQQRNRTTPSLVGSERSAVQT